MAIMGNAIAIVEREISLHEHDSEQKPRDPEIRSAIDTIEGACAQLSSLVARPGDVLSNKFLGYLEPACIQVALFYKIPDLLQEHPLGAHVSVLAERTGLSKAKLSRVLRFLAAKHIFQEVGPDVFANNRLSLELVSGSTLCSLGLCLTNELFKAGSNLSDVLKDPGLRSSTSPLHSAFSKSFGSKTFFDYFSGPSAEQEHADQFHHGMTAWTDILEVNALIYDFPWNALRQGATVCDIGGGVGTMCMKLAKRYPKLRLVLQDLPKPLGTAEKEYWPQRYPEAILENRIEFIPLDFFKGSPKEGCDIYYIKNVLHNWPDDESVKILTNVRKAMGPDSRLLIHDFVISSGYRVPEEDATFTQAPEPLLPNYGEGRIRQYAMDIHMMSLFNAQERTLDHFIELGELAGLRYVKLWEMGDMGLIEFDLPRKQ